MTITFEVDIKWPPPPFSIPESPVESGTVWASPPKLHTMMVCFHFDDYRVSKIELGVSLLDNCQDESLDICIDLHFRERRMVQRYTEQVCPSHVFCTPNKLLSYVTPTVLCYVLFSTSPALYYNCKQEVGHHYLVLYIAIFGSLNSPM